MYVCMYIIIYIATYVPIHEDRYWPGIAIHTCCGETNLLHDFNIYANYKPWLSG